MDPENWLSHADHRRQNWVGKTGELSKELEKEKQMKEIKIKVEIIEIENRKPIQ